MEITNHELKRVMALVMPAVSKTSPLPALEHLLVRAENNVLYMTGGNTEIEITARAQVEGDLPACCVRPARMEAALATGSDLVITPEKGSDSRIIIKTTSGKNRFTADTLPADNFPRFAAEKSGQPVKVSLTDLRHAIRRALPFVAVNDVRYYFNGVNISHADPHIQTAATDGHRLARIKTRRPDDSPNRAWSITMPTQLAEIASKEDWLELHIAADQRTCTLMGRSHECHAKLIDHAYPDISRVIPETSGAMIATVKRADLEHALTATSGYAKTKKHPGAHFQLKDGLLSIETETDTHETARSEIAATGCDFSTGFNPRYINDILKSIGSEEITLHWQNEKGAYRADDGDATFVVVPMRL
ncbi:DNA polymerase III subunit beta [Laribacter hongkongensis]|uniref:DNA polymerase III subunit beta n=1 Tax=Laribacter hongkongensis TaxID=168471 RepID=UPI001EFD4D3C|nr:DNA polymerase III subunit beta [Laribacter hongkongensis]MCG9083965.1 DNA polymerase III subunit beta [Laribacter hongkongensis]